MTDQPHVTSAKVAPTDESNNEPITPKPHHLKSPLITEPLRNHPSETKLAVVRAAIEAGGNVNELDDDPFLGYNEGRPLDACLNSPHMDGGASIRDNFPVIQLLLEHGADPRLRARSIMHPPIAIAKYYVENAGSEEAKLLWKRIFTLFEEAIVKLEEKEGKKAEVR